ESPPAPAVSPCTCRRHGHGTAPGPPCSPPAADHPPPPPADHRRTHRPNRRPHVEKLGRPAATAYPPTPSRSNLPKQDQPTHHRWIRVKWVRGGLTRRRHLARPPRTHLT